MNASEVAAALSGACRSAGWWRCRCPVHASRGSTLALRDGERGLIVHCHAGCSRVDILAELRRRGLFYGDAGISAPPDPSEIELRRDAEARDRQRRIAVALDVWDQCNPAHGTLVAAYWRARGLQEPIPPTIRMHGLMHHRESGGSRPAMFGLVEHIEHGAVGVHITYLAIDGSMKASVVPVKRLLGPVGGGAIRLAPAGETLLVAEGIETAASGMTATAMPAWAALSTSGLGALVLPPVVRTVIILADNDLNGAGQRAARRAAERWLVEGRVVRFAMPPENGTDFNDLLLGRTHARVEEVNDVAA